jgi:hypothetical protein
MVHLHHCQQTRQRLGEAQQDSLSRIDDLAGSERRCVHTSQVLFPPRHRITPYSDSIDSRVRVYLNSVAGN